MDRSESAPFFSRAAATTAVTAALLGGCTFGSPVDTFPSAEMETFRSLLTGATGDASEEGTERQLDDREAPVAAEPSEALLAVATVERDEVDGFTVLTLTPKSDASDLRILYLHGGAWVNPIGVGHLDNMAEIIERTGATVTLPLYGLAPDDTVADATPFLDAIYTQLLEDGPASTIRVGGDSAGGNMALAHVMHWRDLGLDLPAKIFLFAPALDLAFDDPALDALDPLDFLDVDAARVWGRLWAGGKSLQDPIVSPMFGDTTGLPPIFATVGSAEMLFNENREFHTALGSDVVLVRGPDTELPSPRTSPHTLLVYPGAFHVFHHVRSLPEADDLMDRLTTFIEAR